MSKIKLIIVLSTLFLILVFVSANFLSDNSKKSQTNISTANSEEEFLQQSETFVVPKETKRPSNTGSDSEDIISDKKPAIKQQSREIVLPEAEAKHARRIETDEYVTNEINIVSFRDIEYQEFETLMNALSDNMVSQKSIEDQSKYFDIFNQAINAGSQFGIERLECGVSFCLATVIYEDKDYITNLHSDLREKGEFNGKGFGIVGNNSSFIEQNKRGIVFTNSDDRASAFTPFADINRN
ncbi:MAG: hypothetical protein KUG78_08630 [Kangiellaceae bacterium]|nr:hypothetical protein [Kangiellaceae bacterium]